MSDETRKDVFDLLRIRKLDLNSWLKNNYEAVFKVDILVLGDKVMLISENSKEYFLIEKEVYL